MTASTPASKAKKTAVKKPTSVKEWKKKSGAGEPVELPSGNYMIMRRINLQTLMMTGKIPNGLMKIMREGIDKGTGMDGVDMSSMVEDEKQLVELMQFFDDLVCLVSVEPKVHPTPKNEADRDDEVLYADEVDLEDKNFLFAFTTGGTASVEQFREETPKYLAAVSGQQNVELPAVGTASTD